MATTLAKSLRNDLIGNLNLREACSVAPSDSIRQAVQCMRDRKLGCTLVIDQGKLVGIFTERDFVARVVAMNLDVRESVRDVMTPSPRVVRTSDGVHRAVELMESDGFRHLPVLDDDGKPVGVLSVKDIVHYLVEYFPANVYNLPPTPQQTQPAREGA